MKHFRLLYVLMIALCLTGCFFNEWTDAERAAFQSECAQTKTFDYLVCHLRGFENDTFDSICVKEFKDSLLVDSFNVFVPPAPTSNGQPIQERLLTIHRTMHVDHRYVFLLPGQQVSELSNMKMVMWAQYTMSSEGWGCVMGDYMLDGKRFEHNASPVIAKMEHE